jgi:hypothetical protein
MVLRHPQSSRYGLGQADTHGYQQPRRIRRWPHLRRVSDTALGWRAFVALADSALLAQCSIHRFRASGPGGQHRNKTDSAIRLHHRPTGLEAKAVESRSQHENRARALRRLRLAIALTSREATDPAVHVPSTTLASAIRDGRIRINPHNRLYPQIVGEVFDVLEAAGWRMSDAAAALRLTTAALGRFLEDDPTLWRAASQRRQALGLSPLRSQGGR